MILSLWAQWRPVAVKPRVAVTCATISVKLEEKPVGRQPTVTGRNVFVWVELLVTCSLVCGAGLQPMGREK